MYLAEGNIVNQEKFNRNLLEEFRPFMGLVASKPAPLWLLGVQHCCTIKGGKYRHLLTLPSQCN